MKHYKDENNNFYGLDDNVAPPSNYVEITIGDIVIPTPEPTAQDIINSAKSYLASTDWYIIRQQETGTTTPVEILAARTQARIDANEN